MRQYPNPKEKTGIGYRVFRHLRPKKKNFGTRKIPENPISRNFSGRYPKTKTGTPFGRGSNPPHPVFPPGPRFFLVISSFLANFPVPENVFRYQNRVLKIFRHPSDPADPKNTRNASPCPQTSGRVNKRLSGRPQTPRSPSCSGATVTATRISFCWVAGKSPGSTLPGCKTQNPWKGCLR